MAQKLAKNNQKKTYPKNRITKPKINQVLKDVEESGNLSASCGKNGISTAAFYHHLNKSPELQEKYEIARDKACQTLEAEAWNRAVVGEDYPVWFNGEIVGYERRKSDRLLEKLLAANDPVRWSAKQQVDVNHTHEIGSDAHAKLSNLLGITDQSDDDDVIDAEWSETE